MDPNPAIEHDSGARAADTRVAHFLYLMHAWRPSPRGLLAVGRIIVGLVTRDNVRGTWVETHYSWLSRTFVGLLWDRHRHGSP
jgi:uncharacterized membrane protein